MSQSILRSFVFTSILVFSFGLAAQSPDVLHWVGRVLDTDGQPLSGALVALVPRVASEDLKEIPTTRTNDEGGFEITAPSELTDISIAASAHIPLVRSLRLRAAKFGANQSPLEFKLEKGGCRVRGTLKAATGFGLEDGLLAFYNNHSGEMGPFFAPLDPEGRFEITLAASYYDIQAQALGQARIWQQCEITGERSDVKLELQPLPTPAPPEVSTWIQSHAIPLKTFHAGQGFDDMQPLKDLVGSARIVALGEATHGTSEFFRLKHRMLEFLVEEMGFRDFAIEANLPEAFAIDDYLQSGQGDPAKALAGLHFWPWNTEEFLDMLRWMRSYNAKPIHKQKLHFYGIDMQSDALAMDRVHDWISKAAPEEASKLADLRARMDALKRMSSSEDRKRQWNACSTELLALMARMDARKGRLIRLQGEKTYKRQHQCLQVVAQFAAKQAGGMAVRDWCMAVNARELVDGNKGRKLVLWAHNLHIKSNDPSGKIMGCILRRSYGQSYLAIGFAFAEGAFQAVSSDPKDGGLKVFERTNQKKATLDAALGATTFPVMALDLRRLPKEGPVHAWFEAPQGTCSIGWPYGTGSGAKRIYGSTVPASYTKVEPITRSYDAQLFVKTTTAATPVGGHRFSGVDIVPLDTAMTKEPANLGFEKGDAGWFIPRAERYIAGAVTERPKEGHQCLRVTYQSQEEDPGMLQLGRPFFSVMQAVDATPYRGKKIRLKGWTRLSGRTETSAGFWMRVDQNSKRGHLEKAMKPMGELDAWTELMIEGHVDQNVNVLNFGCMATGDCTAWFDDIQIEVVAPE